MATLEELLALLPDNSTGQISAADMRDVITALWDEGAQIEARTALLEASDSSGAGGISVTGVWQINPQAGASPQGGQVTCDTGVFSTATWVELTKVDKSNVDLSLALAEATHAFAQQKADSGNWVRLELADPRTDNGDSIRVAVSPGTSGGATSSAAWQDAIVVLSGLAP